MGVGSRTQRQKWVGGNIRSLSDQASSLHDPMIFSAIRIIVIWVNIKG